MIKIVFGIIVLNGEPFRCYCLRSLYRSAHEIIVLEGASKKAAAISMSDGHSTDGTLDALYQLKTEEDPEDRVKIITKDGFWSEKDEQSQAYAERATGNYLWQVDIDEFYLTMLTRKLFVYDILALHRYLDTQLVISARIATLYPLCQADK